MASSYPQVVLLGDSLLQRSVDLDQGFSFQAALQSHCIRRLDVVNRGFSGWNTSNVVKYLDTIIPKPTESTPKMRYIIILLGANDAVVSSSWTKQHVPIDEYKKNLTQIVTHANIRAHSPKILLVTPPPIDEIKLTKLDRDAGLAECIRVFETSAAYSEKAREVARENAGVVLIDFWQALMNKAISLAPDEYQEGGPWLGSLANGKAGGLDSLLPDGLHLSGEAYRVLWEKIRRHIGSDDAAQDSSGYLYPDWRELCNLGAAPGSSSL
ncbi:hypothetical protein CDD81_766 [Ophiocordyceps australis]|uniref:SGNH hydrolase-type esterase domain-containing protein n=1 Tax=Ophiocordyceps australis TaxID=1399860 RepID=A0A2C5Y2A9_9HYPO|nr:hypothetical protein CDD81_766 [Ophiocordyceps australis]